MDLLITCLVGLLATGSRPAARRGGMRLMLLIGLITSSLLRASATEYRPLPPAAPTGLSTEWLIHDVARNRLILFLPDYHAPAHVYYQYVSIRRDEPFPLAFIAESGLSIFLDNQLLFNAHVAGRYSIDLARRLPRGLSNGPHLLAVWQPSGALLLSSFTAVVPTTAATVATAAQSAQIRPFVQQGQNIYLAMLLLIGLFYGGLRSTFQSGLARVFQLEELFASSPDQQSFLLKPAFSVVNIALIFLFSFSFALLLTAIHTNLQNLPLLRRFLQVSESAVVARVLLYTIVVMGYILGKYIFLELMGYVFDLQSIVNIHYREFLRTTLLASLLVPLVLLAYLSLNTRYPQAVAWVVNGIMGLALIATTLRVTRTLHQKTSLLNLHLFAYLCATEVLPLLVLLRLLVFAY